MVFIFVIQFPFDFKTHFQFSITYCLWKLRNAGYQECMLTSKYVFFLSHNQSAMTLIILQFLSVLSWKTLAYFLRCCPTRSALVGPADSTCWITSGPVGKRGHLVSVFSLMNQCMRQYHDINYASTFCNFASDMSSVWLDRLAAIGK